MFETAEIIYNILNSDPALMALITKVSPLIANQKTDFPFVNFILTEEPTYSKANKFQYTITVNCFAEDYDVTLIVADAVKDAFIAAPQNFNYKGSQPDTQDGIIITTSNYSFKN